MNTIYAKRAEAHEAASGAEPAATSRHRARSSAGAMSRIRRPASNSLSR